MSFINPDLFPPTYDPGIGGASGGDSGGVLPGGGAHTGGGAQNPPASPSSTQGGFWGWLLHVLGQLGGPAIDALPPVTVDPQGNPHRVPSAMGTDKPYDNPAPGPSLGEIWQQITAGAPVVGIYAFLGLLILIGVVGLVLSSSPGQAALGAATGEVSAAAAGVGRAAGRRLVRTKPPPKS